MPTNGTRMRPTNGRGIPSDSTAGLIESTSTSETTPVATAVSASASTASRTDHLAWPGSSSSFWPGMLNVKTR